MWIEIFRAGKHTDSNGRSGEFPPERLSEIASTYNSRILEEPSMLAPVVKGHPKSDAPAFGWVKRLARRGDRLVAFVQDIAADFAEEVRQGKFKKVSISLYPDLMLRHVGFLGAATPAVKGLAEAEFAEKDGASVYEYAGFAVRDDDVEILLAENEKLKSEIETIRKESRLREFREYANSLIATGSGAKILPSQAAGLVDILELAYQLDQSRPQAGNDDNRPGAVEQIKNFVENLKPAFNTSEFASRENGTGGEYNEFASAKVNPKKLKIHRRAKELQESTPGLAYEEAVIEAQRELN